MYRLTNSLSFGNVVSVAALFIALGGASYAAVSLPPASIGAKQLKPDAVGTKQLDNGSVTFPKLSHQVEQEIKHKTGAQGPQGPPGLKGDTGGAGSRGPSDVYYGFGLINANRQLTLPAGSYVVTLQANLTNEVTQSGSFPAFPADDWVNCQVPEAGVAGNVSVPGHGVHNQVASNYTVGGFATLTATSEVDLPSQTTLNGSCTLQAGSEGSNPISYTLNLFAVQVGASHQQ
jgi:hypothetical protein